MAYAIVGVVVVLIVAGFVIFMVLNATGKSSPAADTPREGAPGIGADDTPLGDTGAGRLLDAVRALRRSAEVEGGRDHRQGPRLRRLA